jgi:hypothetical protein
VVHYFQQEGQFWAAECSDITSGDSRHLCHLGLTQDNENIGHSLWSAQEHQDCIWTGFLSSCLYPLFPNLPIPETSPSTTPPMLAFLRSFSRSKSKHGEAQVFLLIGAPVLMPSCKIHLSLHPLSALRGPYWDLDGCTCVRGG